MSQEQSQPKRKRFRRSRRARRNRRGIYMLPNLLTTGALFFGFFAIVQGSAGKFETAVIAILIATVLDGLDGRVARITNTSSDFGKEYDSLSDVICFGLAPVLVLLDWTLGTIGKIGWLCAFLYVSATALRLARFNTQVRHNQIYFQGMPCPMAAAFLVAWLWIMESTIGSSFQFLSEVTAVIVVLLSLAMVSAIPYPSFKNFGMKGRVPFLTSVGAVFLIAIISFDPPKVIFTLVTAYVVSGPFIWISRKNNRKKKQTESKNSEESHENLPKNK